MEVLMVVGFLLGAYSIVGNDAIQTLGTFLSSQLSPPVVGAMALCRRHPGLWSSYMGGWSMPGMSLMAGFNRFQCQTTLTGFTASRLLSCFC